MSTDQVPPEWKEISPDPDPTRDLGYELIDLEIFRTNDGTDRFMLLPSNEEMLADDAFIVASESAVCNVTDRV